MDDYLDMLKQKRREEAQHPIRDAAKSAAIWGGLAGGAAQLAAGNRSVPSILLRSLGAGAIAAPTVAASTALGNAVLGQPDADDPTGYSLRGGVGGALGGGALGGGLGYLLGSGRLRGLSNIPHAAKAARLAKEVLPLDNLITDKLRHWAARPSHEAGLKAAALLGLGGGALAGMHGATEGMDIDFLRNLRRRREEKERLNVQS